MTRNISDRQESQTSKRTKVSRELPSELVAVPFRVNCKAQQVSLLLSTGGGSAILLATMEQMEANEWEIVLRLVPGEYCYRYYAFDSNVTHYCPPAHWADGLPAMNGMDAMLHVAAPSHESQKRIVEFCPFLNTIEAERSASYASA